MRIAEYKQIGTKEETRTRVIPATYDDEGNLLTEETTEEYTIEVPVMGMVYRDATPEEIAESERQQAEIPEQEPSPEERLNALEAATDDMILLMADLIGGN